MMEMEMNAELDRNEGSESRESVATGSSAGTIFCSLEQDYAKITREMKNNDALAPFEAEYTRLFESLYKCHREEEDLIEQCSALKEEVVEGSHKIRELEKIVENDAENIAKLKEEIVNAMKLADAAHTREQNAQEVIENLRSSIDKLNHELEQKRKQLTVEEESVTSKLKDGLLKDRERLMGELETLRHRLRTANIHVEELEKKNNDMEQKIGQLQEAVDVQITEAAKERRAREKVEEDHQQLHEEFKNKENDLQSLNSSLQTAAGNVMKLEHLLKEQKSTNDKLQRDVNKLLFKRMHLQTELDQANLQIDEMLRDVMEKSAELKMLQSNDAKMREELKQIRTEKDQSDKKIEKIERIRGKLEAELNRLRADSKNTDTEIITLKKQLNEEKKNVQSLIREKEILTKNVTNCKTTISRISSEWEILSQNKKQVESELEAAVESQRQVLKKLEATEKERDKFHAEVKELTLKVEDYADEVKLKQVEILDYKKRLSEADAKFRQQQNLFESVRADRNSCSKSLIEAQDQVQELKSKLKITNHQVEQLKEDLAAKEADLIKGEFLLGKLEKEKDKLRVELMNSQDDVRNFKQTVEKMRQEEKQLRQALLLADMDVNKQRKDLETLMIERDILGTQLVRRNDELRLQLDRIKILNATINRGESEYNKRLEDIRLLKLEVKKLRNEKMLLSKSISNISDLRQEVFHLDRDLTRERLKVMALEEELQNPLNIHRWRKLEGTDPSSYELLKKIQILQKRILKMSSEMIGKEKKVRDTEKLYMNLREILAKHPGPEVTYALDETKKALQERGKKMKCLISELNMFETQANEYKYDMERMTKEMGQLKSKFFAQKREMQKSKINRAKSSTTTFPPVREAFNQKKFCGGGFNMITATSGSCFTFESHNK